MKQRQEMQWFSASVFRGRLSTCIWSMFHNTYTALSCDLFGEGRGCSEG